MLTAHAIKEISNLRHEVEAKMIKLAMDEKLIIGRRAIKHGMGRVQRIKRRAEINEQVAKGRLDLVAMEDWALASKPNALRTYWKGLWLMDKRADNYTIDARATYARALHDKGYIRLVQCQGRYMMQRTRKGIIGYAMARRAV